VLVNFAKDPISSHISGN